MFCWRLNSEKIFNKILSSNSIDDSEEETDSDEDDLTTSCSAFDSPPARGRNFPDSMGDEEIEKKLKLWTDLTNIDMGPYANSARIRSLDTQIQHRKAFMGPTASSGQKEEMIAVETNMSLTFKFQYLIISEKLKVTVVGGNNLPVSSNAQNGMEMFARVCLTPSKVQPKNTDLVGGSAHPEFNSVVFFNGLSLQDVHQTSLRLAVYCRNKRAWQFRNIGEVVISLENYDLTSETTMNKCLDASSLHMSKIQYSFRIKSARH